MPYYDHGGNFRPSETRSKEPRRRNPFCPLGGWDDSNDDRDDDNNYSFSPLGGWSR